MIGSLSIDRGSPVPLYYQLSQQLEAAIADGILKPGDRIDTEMDIAEKYGLSRPTVRQAIQELVSKGLLIRRRGVGTQVVQAQVRRQLGLTSLFDDLVQGKRRPRTNVIAVTRGAASDDVAAALQLASGAEVLYLERVRFEADEPLALMRNWLPAELIDATAEDLEQSGLYELLRGSGIHMRVAHQRIGAKAATVHEARLLEVRKGSPLLTMERTAFDDGGRPVEYGDHAYRADSYTFETTLTNR